MYAFSYITTFTKKQPIKKVPFKNLKNLGNNLTYTPEN